MVNFLHGVETIEIESGPRPVTEVKSAVIGLVGIAPTEYGQNVPILVKNDVEAAQFGKALPGFDIPQTLNFIFGHNAGTVIVVNVFDIDTHTTNVVEESHAVAAGKLKLAFAPIGAVAVLDDEGEPTAYVKGTDYTLDEYGNFTVLSGSIANGVGLKFTYKKLNIGALTNSHIIGSVDGGGNRTGMKAWDLSFNLFGFRPKILIAPGRSATKAIADELLSAADRLKAVAIIDGVFGESVATTIANRGNATKAFGTSSKRAILAYPYLQAYDASKDDGGEDTDTSTNYPFSMFLAGVMAANDRNNGYWWSPSNKNFIGVTGVERPISANLSDPDTDANALNEAGIMTVFNAFGTGYRAWGNRNASWPTNTRPDNFIPLLRTFDIAHESLEHAAIDFSDRPITNALKSDILQSGNDFIAVLVGRGALTQGSRVVFDPAENSVSELSNGHATFTIIKDGPSPLERLTYKSVIDTGLKAKALL